MVTWLNLDTLYIPAIYLFGSAYTELHYCTYIWHFVTLTFLPEFSLAVTVIEVLPKDKKGKEEKTIVLGQSCIDLLSLIYGEQ